MKAKYIMVLMVLCATVSLQAQSRKERRKEELELLREEKQEEDEEKEEALREAQEKIRISRNKLIFDVLNNDLLVKLCSEVVFCMEKYRYKLQEVGIYEHMDDLKKYATNTPLNKMPEVSLSKQVELHFDKDITARVGFSYDNRDGDDKYIQLLSGNDDFDKKIKEFQTIKALQPLGKFKLSALDYREDDENKLSKESLYIDLMYDYIDISKVVFESKINTLVEAKVLGKKLVYHWENAPKSTLLAGKVIDEHLKKRFTQNNAVNGIQNLMVIQELHQEYAGKSYDYSYHSYYKNGNQPDQVDFAAIQWAPNEEGEKTMVGTIKKGTPTDTTLKYQMTELEKKVELFQTPFLSFTEIKKLDIFQEEVFEEAFSGHQCFRVDSKRYKPARINDMTASSQLSFFFDINTFHLIGTRGIHKSSNFIFGNEQVYDNFKVFEGQLLPIKNLQYSLNDLMERKPNPSIMSYDYKFNTTIDASIFSTDFSKTYPRN